MASFRSGWLRFWISLLHGHLNIATVFKGTSKTVQNEFLDCMLFVYRKFVVKGVVVSRRLPKLLYMRWILSAVLSIWFTRAELAECVEEILTYGKYHSVTLHEASGLLTHMEYSNFLCLMSHFCKIIPHVDALCHQRQKCCTDQAKISNNIAYFETVIKNVE
jgi:hypothetical protein